SGHELPGKIISTTDGGSILVGYSSSSDGDISENKGWDDCWVLKLDENGSIQWERSLGGTSRDLGNNILQTDDKGYLIAATTKSTDGDVSENHGGTDFWLLKTDAEGNIEWERTYGGSEDETFAEIKQLNDSCLLLLGSSRSSDGDIESNYGGKDYWLVKTDTEGNLLWEQNYGGSESDNGASIALKKDGGFVLGGSSKSSDGDVSKNRGLDDYWLASCDAGGNILWQRSYGGSNNDVLKQIEPMDGGYLLTGYSFSYDIDVTDNHGSSDMWVVKTYNNGLINWERSLGGSKTDGANAMAFSSDFGYLIAGYTASNDGDVEESSGNIDMWVVKLCEDFDIYDDFTICTGDSLLWEGNYYFENGSSDQKSFTSQCGKDSLRSMSLAIVDYPENFTIEGDTLVLAFTSAIYTVPVNNAITYEFIIINGEIMDSLVGDKIKILWGTYGTGTIKAIAKNAAGCATDTAYLSVRLAGLGVEESKFPQIKIYPNPLHEGLLQIQGINIEKIEVLDLAGRPVYMQHFPGNTSQLSINLSRQPKGSYYLKIRTRKTTVSKMLIIM
ncbi:MAG: T9SS type A sorting domain-containing protein, partial [Bacteroidales bacterium]|nr:T9SS type A sorting domain-containing protein [Bacteroidales bacterium]